MNRRFYLSLVSLLSYQLAAKAKVNSNVNPQIHLLQNSRVRNTSANLLLYQPEYGFRGPTAGLEPAAEWATPIIYMPPGLHTINHSSGRVFDHSDDGINEAAARTTAFLKEKFDRYHTNVALFDIEKFRSATLSNDNEAIIFHDLGESAIYSPLAAPSVREEAARFQRILASRIYEMLEAEGLSAELGWYNIPRSPGWQQRSPKQIQLQVERTYSDTFQSLIEPLAAFVGPSAQIIVTRQALASYARKDLSASEFIKWKVDTCLAYRKRLGHGVKIIPTIWPRWYVSGRPWHDEDYPDRDVVVPPGFMTELCSALLDDAGVSGFMCWRASTDDNLGVLHDDVEARLSERWGEVAELVRQRRDFLRLY